MSPEVYPHATSWYLTGSDLFIPVQVKIPYKYTMVYCIKSFSYAARYGRIKFSKLFVEQSL